MTSSPGTKEFLQPLFYFISSKNFIKTAEYFSKFRFCATFKVVI